MDFQKALIELNSNDNKVLLESLKVISMRAFREPSTVESIITDSNFALEKAPLHLEISIIFSKKVA